MNLFHQDRREIAVLIGAVAVVLVLALVGCQGAGSARGRALRDRHISLSSATTTGPAVGVGGSGSGGRHGNWISAETRGLFDVKEIAKLNDQPATTGSPDALIGPTDVTEVPEIPEPASETTELVEPLSDEAVRELMSPELMPRPGEEDLALAAQAQLKTIYFDFDKAEVREDQMELLRANADWLREHPTVAVNLGGHCDERGTEEYNLALSERRAASVREALITLGIQPHRMSAVPYGEAQPADPQHTEEAWAQNRRVEFAPTAVQLLSMSTTP